MLRPFTLPANSQVQIPSKKYTFNGPEGTLLTLNGVFDHPSCGIRGETKEQLDTEEIFTVDLMTAVGFYNADLYITSLIPPRTMDGIYAISMQKEWPWTEWARLYVFNTDSVAHICFKYSYTMAVLKDQNLPKGED